MIAKWCLLSLLWLEAAAYATSLTCNAQSRSHEFGNQPASRDAIFTLQLSAFPSDTLAAKFAAELREAGEHPFCVQADIPGRGLWTRVLTGSFDSLQSARRYGRKLVAKGLTKSFLVRSRTEVTADSQAGTASALAASGGAITRGVVFNGRAGGSGSIMQLDGLEMPINFLPVKLEQPTASRSLLEAPLSRVTATRLSDALPADTRWDPIRYADLAPAINPEDMPLSGHFRPAPEEGPIGRKGGVWLGGDVQAALKLLRSIAGPEAASALAVDLQGRLELNLAIIRPAPAQAGGQGAAGVGEQSDYADSNEGLRLLVQLSRGTDRYQFYVGKAYSTRGGIAAVAGTMNLDCGFDSRINPRRPGLKKFDEELPPAGFDAAVALNPSARWVNVQTGRPVPLWIIAFHELAEAYSKVALGLDYLPVGYRPGAHQVAIEREVILASQRRSANLVLTTGSNMVFKSEDEMEKYLTHKE